MELRRLRVELELLRRVDVEERRPTTVRRDEERLRCCCSVDDLRRRWCWNSSSCGSGPSDCSGPESERQDELAGDSMVVASCAAQGFVGAWLRWFYRGRLALGADG